MNYEETLWQLWIRRGIANSRITISETAKQRVSEQQFHTLNKSQVRALSSTLSQGHTSHDHLKSLNRFFGPEGVRKREREGRGWLAKVTEKGTRLEVVYQDINRWLAEAKIIVEKAQAPEAKSDFVAEELIAYYIHVLEAWATLKSDLKKGVTKCANATSSQEC